MDVIARYSGDVILVDYEGLWVHSGRRAISTIRRYCEPIACDVATHLLLFDANASKETLARVPSRASRPRSRRAA
jgi:hypothetical protein